MFLFFRCFIVMEVGDTFFRSFAERIFLENSHPRVLYKVKNVKKKEIKREKKFVRYTSSKSFRL